MLTRCTEGCRSNPPHRRAAGNSIYDLDVFNVLYVLDDLDDLDVLDVLDVLDLAKVCSEKISLIELHCRNVKLIFHSPYIWVDMLRSYKLDWMGMGWVGISV